MRYAKCDFFLYGSENVMNHPLNYSFSMRFLLKTFDLAVFLSFSAILRRGRVALEFHNHRHFAFQRHVRWLICGRTQLQDQQGTSLQWPLTRGNAGAHSDPGSHEREQTSTSRDNWDRCSAFRARVGLRKCRFSFFAPLLARPSVSLAPGLRHSEEDCP